MESTTFPATFFREMGLQAIPDELQDGCWLTGVDDALVLVVSTGGEQQSTCVDFCDAALQYRLRTSGKRQGIGQAVGLNRHSGLSVVDCTAGLGRDAFILAGLGCTVTMLERNPVVHAMLADGLRRGRESEVGQVRDICERLELFSTDASTWLGTLTGRPDVIYLDPMFPERRKSAKVKKNMAGLQQLLGPDHDVLAVLELARQKAGRRVVVKRPRSSDDSWLEGRFRADFRITGKAMQFDVFLPA